MPQTCSICIHPDRREINKELLNRVPLRHIASQYGTSTGALQRHRPHIPHLLAKAKGAQEAVDSEDILTQVKALRNKAIGLLMKAEQGGDYRTALSGVREARACLELLAELEGELNRNPQVNILISPQWVTIRAVVVDALREFPTARAVVAERLMQLESESV